MEFGAKGQRKNKALDVFKNFKGRHAGLVKALTTDVEEFFKQCDPGADLGFQERGTSMLEVSSLKLLPAQVKEKENLCLYGLPNEQWAVNLPAGDSPPGLPEPVLGINFARDGMQLKEWLSFVAYHSDAWLLAVAFYAGARFGFSKAERKQLFDMINALPTIHEVVTGVPKTQQKEESTVSNQSKNKSKPNANKRALESRGKFTKLKRKYEEEEDEDEEDEDGWYIEKDVEEEQGESLCGTCGRKYEENEFWICCDTCETWFHGQCVKITAAAAEHRKLYKCPPCVSKRSRTRCTEY